MKKFFQLTQLMPAVAIGMAAVLGLQMTTPILDEVVWPEKPQITVEAKEKKDKKADAEENTEVEQGVGNYTDGTFTGEGVGYGGKVNVQVTVASKQITSVDILSHNDTDEFFNKAKNTVVSEILTQQTWEVDSVSGATYSSRGIKEAVCNALTGQVSSSTEPEKVGPSSSLKTNSFQVSAWADGTYTGSANGFGGSIKVQVTILAGKITSIKVLSHSGETGSYYSKATGIIGRILKSQTPNVDTISGATYSSNGIREAVKNALRKAAGASKKTVKIVTQTPTPKQKTEEVTVPDGSPADGTYTGVALCEQSPRFSYYVTIKATYKDGELVDVNMSTNDNGNNQTYIDKAWSGLKTELFGDMTGSVDVVSRATYTSNAIKTAYKLAYKQAVEANGGKVEEDTTEENDAGKDTTKKQSGSAATESSKDATDSADKDDTTDNPQKKEDGPEADQQYNTDGKPADGSYKVSIIVDSYDAKKESQRGYFTNYTLTGTVIFKDHKLSDIKNFEIGDEPDDYEYEEDSAYVSNISSTMVSRLVNAQSSNVDTVSSATCSSKGIIALYEKALEQAIKAQTALEKAEAERAKEQEEKATESTTTETKETTSEAEDATQEENATSETKDVTESKTEEESNTSASEAKDEISMQSAAESSDEQKNSTDSKKVSTDTSKNSADSKKASSDTSKDSTDSKKESTTEKKKETKKSSQKEDAKAQEAEESKTEVKAETTD